MNYVEELEHLAEEDLCHECRNVLTEREKELGYICFDCIKGWCEEAFHEGEE